MTGTRRIQRKRTRGWRMPAGAVYVGRSSKWGNPFEVGAIIPILDEDRKLVGEQKLEDAAAACKAFRDWCNCYYSLDDYADLRGKDLACWCPLDQPCHADVLLELANAPEGAT